MTQNDRMSKFETRRHYAISIYDTVAYGQSIKRNRIDILWSYFNIYHRIVFFDRHRREITYSFKSTVSNWLYYLPLPVITSNVHSHVYWSYWYLPELFCKTEKWRYVFFNYNFMMGSIYVAGNSLWILVHDISKNTTDWGTQPH